MRALTPRCAARTGGFFAHPISYLDDSLLLSPSLITMCSIRTNPPREGLSPQPRRAGIDSVPATNGVWGLEVMTIEVPVFLGSVTVSTVTLDDG